MRFLHTADWHLGQKLRGRSRQEEFEAVLMEVLSIALREKIDCLLLAGDIFHTTSPPPEAEELLVNFLRGLYGSHIPAVLVTGNHDHPRRLAAFSRVLELAKVHLIARPNRVRITSRDGSEQATIAGLPWVHEREAIHWQALAEGRSHEDYAESVGQIIRDLMQPRPGINIFLSHLMIDGATVGGGERALHLGNVYAIRPEALPQVDYIALGHIHRAQFIDDAPGPASYAGSLLQLDFGERRQEKSVKIINIEGDKPAQVETVPIESGRRLRDLEGEPTALLNAAATAYPSADISEDDYLRIRVLIAQAEPGVIRQIREAFPNAVEIQAVYPDREAEGDGGQAANLSPHELLAAYHQATYSAPISPEVLQLFQQLHGETAAE